MNESYQALIDSGRIGQSTGDALARRAIALHNGLPRLLSDAHYATLDAVTRRLLPQSASEDFVDIAAGIDMALQDGKGDGWRYADLPRDADTFAAGLHWIESLAIDRFRTSFVDLKYATQDRLLRDIFAGGGQPETFNGRRWCEDLLALAAELYVSHPTTLARIGFSGIAFRPEWLAVGLGTTQPWERAVR